MDHHLRVMEWMMRVLMPEMTRRAGRAASESLGGDSPPYPAPDKVINGFWT